MLGIDRVMIGNVPGFYHGLGQFLLRSLCSKMLLHGRVLCVLSLLVASCLLFGGALAISSPEAAALRQILVAFPNLSNLTLPQRIETTPSTTFVSRGRSWPSDMSTVCQNGEGYDLVGIYCSATGHVVAVNVYVVMLACIAEI